MLANYLEQDIKGEVDSESRLVGQVEIKLGAKIENSLVRGPTSIAKNCQIRNSSLGPFASIGVGTVIEGCSIEHSVVLEGCHILGVKSLTDSIVGRNTVIKAGENLQAVRLFIGDDARIELE